MKLLVNTLVDSRIKMSPNVGSDKAWVWSCFDFSEQELKEEVFSIKFHTPEQATEFKTAFETACKEQEALNSGADGAPSAGADEAAEALEKLNTAEAEEPAAEE